MEAADDLRALLVGRRHLLIATMRRDIIRAGRRERPVDTGVLNGGVGADQPVVIGRAGLKTRDVLHHRTRFAVVAGGRL